MSFEDELDALKAVLDVAEHEVITAIQFHESWKLAAVDTELIERMGTSYATHTFQIIRWALRREAMLSLWKVWDPNPKAVSFSKIVGAISQGGFLDKLVTRRAERSGLQSAGVRPAFARELEAKFDKALALVRKYQAGGTGIALKEKLTALRHERLAHRQKSSLTTAAPEFTDEDLEQFYNDNLELLELLNSLIAAKSFDMTETVGVYQTYASNFWAGVKGERTEGHPRYKKPLTVNMD